MKLAIVTAFPPSKVTLNEYAYHLVKQLRQNTNVSEIVLLTDVEPKQVDLNFKEAGCKVTVEHCWSFNSLKNIFTVAKTIDRIQPDSVLFNLQFMKFGDNKTAAALGLMLPGLCRLKKIPTITLLHNILETVDLDTAGFTSNPMLRVVFGFFGSILTRFILQSHLVAVTMSKYVDILEEKYGAKNVIQIPHGTFEVAAEPDYSIAQEGPLQVMTFGKFGTYKRVEGLIEAVQAIRQRTDLDLEIVIAGTDNPNIPGYLETVKKQYAHVPQIRFTGYVAEEDVARLFEDAAAVVFPYTSTTGSSGVLHQAGSYGKAVVMPDLGDLALLMQDEGYEGELFDPHSTESLSVAIEKIVSEASYRVAMGVANYQAATAYPMSRIADMYIRRFQDLAETTQSVDQETTLLLG